MPLEKVSFSFQDPGEKKPTHKALVSGVEHISGLFRDAAG
jgi:hypothetical protein